MPLRHIQATVSQTLTQRIVFILDTSESAKSTSSTLHECVEGVASQLPGDIEQSLYFVGSDVAVPMKEFSRRSGDFLRRYGNRLSVISPILTNIGLDDTTTVLIVGDGRIYDIADWDTEAYRKQIVLVYFGKPLQEPDGLFVELTSPQTDEILPYLYDPVERITLMGEAFMPTYWDNPHYNLKEGTGGMQLVLEGNENFQLRLQCFTTGELSAEVTYRSSRTATFELPEVAIPSRQPSDPLAGLKSGGFMPTGEADIFTSAVKTGQYTCPYCPLKHDKRKLACTPDGEDDFGGIFIYKSLRAQNITGILLLAIKERRVEYYRQVGNVLPLSDGRIAIHSNGNSAGIYQFSETVCAWKPTHEQMHAYDHVGVDSMGRDLYAFFL